jgi:3-oxoacyl-[acyl-carrier protein] reductase
MTHAQAREFEDRVVLVTGAARNIGRAIAESFAAAGARVAINARSSLRELDEVVRSITADGNAAMACPADITDRAAVDRMVESVLARWGRIDILVNNAVSHTLQPFEQLAYDDWHRSLAVTLDGAFHCVQACLPAMTKAGGGSIVNLGGLFGHVPARGRAATSVSKAGLAGLTRALALELGEHNINVNYVAPGPANTVREVPLKFDMRTIPMGRFVEPSEVAAVVKMLCSAEGRYITGQTLHVNGGLHMAN